MFRQNLYKIVQDHKVIEHSPRIILITPPPIDERTQRALDDSKGYPLRRSAKNTKAYADAVRDVANELSLPFVDMWSKCMELAGWKEGQPLEGSQDLPPNPMLTKLLSDGEWLLSQACQLRSGDGELSTVGSKVY
jgi:isoamyl acetate esterase